MLQSSSVYVVITCRTFISEKCFSRTKILITNGFNNRPCYSQLQCTMCVDIRRWRIYYIHFFLQYLSQTRENAQITTSEFLQHWTCSMLTVISVKQFLKEIQKRKYKYCVASRRTSYNKAIIYVPKRASQGKSNITLSRTEAVV